MSMLGRQFEQFAGQMRQAAGTGGGKIELAGLRLGERDQFAHVVGRNVARDHQHFRHGHDQRDRREILQRRRRRRFPCVGLMASAPALEIADGVAVGFGFRHRIGAEHAALAAAIVDHAPAAWSAPTCAGRPRAR